MDSAASSPDGFVNDRQNIYDQARASLSPDEWRRFTRSLAAAIKVGTVPEQVVTMHGLAHHAAVLGDSGVADTFKAMAHATAIDFTTETEIAAFGAELAEGMPPEPS